MITGGTWIASDYLQPRIGSDIALFKGLAKAVLEAGGDDQHFISAHTTGFDAYLADLAGTDWTTVTLACGIDRNDIVRVARRYCDSEHTVFAWGMGVTHHLHGVANVEAIANLALLRGMIGRRYAGLLPLRGHSNVQGIGTIGVKPVLPEEVFARMEQSLGVTLPRSAGMDTMAGLEAAARGEIDLALMMGGNLYAATPNSAWAQAALDRISCKLYLTTTLNRGHVSGIDRGECLIFPVTARDEEWQPTTQESMFNYVRLSDGGIDRLDNVRPEVNVLTDMALRLFDDPALDFEVFKTHRHVRKAIGAIVPGMEELASIDVAKREFHVRGRLLHTPEFKTPDGRARFRVQPIPAAPATADGNPAPFVLSTVRSEGQFNTIVYEYRDSYRQTEDRWVVMMNPDDARARQLEDGDRVTLVSAQGRMADVRVQRYDLPPGNLMAYFPEANVLTSTAVDPMSRTPAFKSTPVWIE